LPLPIVVQAEETRCQERSTFPYPTASLLVNLNKNEFMVDEGKRFNGRQQELACLRTSSDDYSDKPLALT
jgi:hypothetical protein